MARARSKNFPLSVWADFVEKVVGLYALATDELNILYFVYIDTQTAQEQLTLALCDCERMTDSLIVRFEQTHFSLFDRLIVAHLGHVDRISPRDFSGRYPTKTWRVISSSSRSNTVLITSAYTSRASMVIKRSRPS